MMSKAGMSCHWKMRMPYWMISQLQQIFETVLGKFAHWLLRNLRNFLGILVTNLQHMFHHFLWLMSVGISIPVTTDNHLTIMRSQETLYRKDSVIKITWSLYSGVCITWHVNINWHHWQCSISLNANSTQSATRWFNMRNTVCNVTIIYDGKASVWTPSQYTLVTRDTAGLEIHTVNTEFREHTRIIG